MQIFLQMGVKMWHPERHLSWRTTSTVSFFFFVFLLETRLSQDWQEGKVYIQFSQIALGKEANELVTNVLFILWRDYYSRPSSQNLSSTSPPLYFPY